MKINFFNFKYLIRFGIHLGGKKKDLHCNYNKGYILGVREDWMILNLEITLTFIKFLMPILKSILKKKIIILFLSLNFNLYDSLKLCTNKCFQEYYVPERWVFGTLTNFVWIK
jgi:ribosomal protein S2